MAIESTCQSAVETLPRRFGRCGDFLPPLSFSVQQRNRTRFDGGSEVDVLREEADMGVELTPEQQTFLSTEDRDAWRRPSFPLRVDTTTAEVSTYRRTLDAFAVSRCPLYRRLRIAKACPAQRVEEDVSTAATEDAEALFFQMCLL
jgi:hypothetical protein